MDTESWLKGYFAGVRLHGNIRHRGISPHRIAAMSRSGISGIFDWMVDISATEVISRLSVEYTGNLQVSYSFNGKVYAPLTDISKFLSQNPQTLFGNLNKRKALCLRFLSSDGPASLSCTLYGYLSKDFFWNQ